MAAPKSPTWKKPHVTDSNDFARMFLSFLWYRGERSKLHIVQRTRACDIITHRPSDSDLDMDRSGAKSIGPFLV